MNMENMTNISADTDVRFYYFLFLSVSIKEEWKEKCKKRKSFNDNKIKYIFPEISPWPIYIYKDIGNISDKWYSLSPP